MRILLRSAFEAGIAEGNKFRRVSSAEFDRIKANQRKEKEWFTNYV